MKLDFYYLNHSFMVNNSEKCVFDMIYFMILFGYFNDIFMIF